ncbi:MAG: hypothetical protein QOK24_1199 [Verrucomicrobiota bacterium]|jgi:hypothetical protein
MKRSEVTADEFDALVRPLIGMSVSLPWKGYGSTIFLELGQLSPLPGPQRHDRGEACIWVDWDWRIEEGAKVVCGSSNRGPEIEKGIAGLQGSTVESLCVAGEVRELVASFSNGRCLKSMIMRPHDPQWSIRLSASTWLFSEAGLLYAGDGGATELTDEERAVFDTANATAQRWGEPVAEPKIGNCRDCRSFIRLDGNGALLDYGACIESASPFDGRVVNCSSGCAAFSSR